MTTERTEDTGQNPKPTEGDAAAEPEIEFGQDTSVPPEDAGKTPPAQDYDGYGSVEELLKAHREARRKISEQGAENAVLRRSIEERASSPEKGEASMFPDGKSEEINEKFREHLNSDPFGSLTRLIRMVIRQEGEETGKRQRKIMETFQSLSDKPEFSPVADKVAKSLYLMPQDAEPEQYLENQFLKASLQRFSAEQVERGEVTPPFVEGGRSAQRGGNVTRIDLENDDRMDKLRRSLPPEEFKKAASLLAKHRAAGGKRVMTLDDYERATR